MIEEMILFFDEVFTLFGRGLDAVIDFFQSIFPAKQKTEYEAEFISASTLSATAKGFCLTGTRSVSIKDSYSNGIVLGGTGSGKSSQILIPSILKMMGSSSLIIHDPSGELYSKTSGALAANGYIVKSLNYSDPETSEGYNPLRRAKSISDIQKIAQQVVHNALGQSKDPFWNMAATGLIILFCRYLIGYAPASCRTLHNVLYLISVFSSSPEKIDKLIVRTNDAALITEYKSFNSYDNKMLMSIVATARTALSIFADPSVEKVTSEDTLRIENFRKRKIALFINNSVKDMRYYSVISSIFFEQLFGEIMSCIPGDDELSLFFLLDEASSLHLLSLPSAISNIRKFKSGIFLIYQHIGQLHDAYGLPQARNILANCFCKVHMSGVPIQEAEELEKTLGKFRWEEENGREHLRPLRTADQIRLLKESIILCGNNKPICARMTPYFQQTRLRRLSEIPPYQLKNKLSPAEPPLIQFDNDAKG